MSDIIGPDGSRIPMEPEMASRVNQQIMNQAMNGLLFGGGPSALGGEPQINPGMVIERLMRRRDEEWMKGPVSLEVTDELVEKGYEAASPALFATGKFKEMYPTFEIYKNAMADMKIPLDLVVKQRAKGPSYHSIPATEAEYMARAGKEDWSSIKSAIDSIPRHRPGGLDTLTDLKAKFPDMPKAEFDEMMLKLSREGKISLHHHDMPGSYKGEMIKDGNTFYHAFGVKPEWRDQF
jgi:hypothetical protein